MLAKMNWCSYLKFAFLDSEADHIECYLKFVKLERFMIVNILCPCSQMVQVTKKS